MAKIIKRSALLAALCYVGANAADLSAAGAAAGVAHPDRWPQAHSQGLVDPVTEARVTGLLDRMSLEEKVGQMIQGAIYTIRPEDLRKYPLGSVLIGGDTPPLSGDERGPAQAWVETARAYRSVSIEARPNHTPIPVLFGSDIVHGNSNVRGATLFPHNVGLGAAHDPELVRRIGEASAQESLVTGFDWAFAPTIALPQDYRWGRSYEGYSEDPKIVREYARQIVLGLQGQPGAGRLLQSGHLAASAKHFLADGATFDGTDQGDSRIDEAELMRVHAPGYEAAVDAGVMTVMASYSSWQGSKMHGNRSLLTDVLKGRFGFEGFVIGDWNGHAQLPLCTKRTCPAAANAGVDMYMAPEGWRALFDHLIAQVKSGQVPMARIDDAVRRILRVKIKLGLFEPERPWEGRYEVLGSKEHRALAREAVRKSLVLLKNNGGVLPIRAKAHVLVAGAGADSIPQQCGGWTLSWQGDGNKNSDFPNAESIYHGIEDAVRAGGGSVELNADGDFKTKPDVAIVIFGEQPYAEYYGDLRTIDFEHGDKHSLALLKKLKATGVPIVSVFLSGRPLWVNAELNASDAFVAAWLPGSEGGGIADVLIGDASGNPRHDFSGKLSFSWPKKTSQTGLRAMNAGGKYDPLFPLGFGLTYADHRTLAALDEHNDVGDVAPKYGKFLVAGQAQAPWKFATRGGDAVTASEAKGAVSVDWTGKGTGTATLEGAPVSLLGESNFRMAYAIRYRVDKAPSSQVTLEMLCGDNCRSGVLDFTPFLKSAKVGAWEEVHVRLTCFRESGIDISRVTNPIAIKTSGSLRLSLSDIHLVPEPDMKTCPQDLHGEE